MANSLTQKTVSDPSENTPTHRVIQCPNCQTKFAVDSSVLSGLDFPRFHCSRCDNIFALEASSITRAPLFPQMQPKASSPSQEEFLKEFPTDHDEEKDQSPHSQPTVHRSYPVPPFEKDSGSLPYVSSSDLPADTFTMPEQPPENSHEEFRSFMPKRVEAAAPILGEEQLEMPLEIPSTFGSASPGIEETQVIPSWEEYKSQNILNTGPTVQPMTSRQNSIQPPLSEPELTSSTDHLAAVASIARGSSSRWYGLGVLALPLVALLVLLIGTTLFMNSSPASASSIVKSMFPNIKLAAPQDLFIKDTQFKRILLDSGDSVSLITGVVVNKSSMPVRNIEIEAAAFNSAGEIVARRKLPASATLAKSRIHSLSLDMIESIQTGPARKITQLKPGERTEFAIALFGPELSRARFFSARVFSVRQ